LISNNKCNLKKVKEKRVSCYIESLIQATERRNFMNQYKQLTQGQRYQIYAFCKAGYLQKEIAEELGVAPSTISRELRRNRCGKG